MNRSQKRRPKMLKDFLTSNDEAERISQLFFVKNKMINAVKYYVMIMSKGVNLWINQ